MEIEIRIVKGCAELGNENGQVQYRTWRRGQWSEWKLASTVTDDRQLIKA